MKRTPCFTDKLRPDVKFQPQQEPRPACPERYQRCRETIGRLKPRKSVGKMPAALDPPGSKTGPQYRRFTFTFWTSTAVALLGTHSKVRPNFLRTINRCALFCSRRSGRRGNPLACSSRARKLKPKCHARSERKGRNLFHNFPQLDRRASTAHHQDQAQGAGARSSRGPHLLLTIVCGHKNQLDDVILRVHQNRRARRPDRSKPTG